MAAAGGEEKKMAPGWLWLPVSEDDKTHPAELPKDEATSALRWHKTLRGPRLARIHFVSVILSKKAASRDLLWVEQDGKEREVPKHMVLHVQEGHLILQELLKRHGDNRIAAEWLNSELRNKFETHSAGKVVSGHAYVQRLLATKAVTGAKVTTDNGREASWRREIQDRKEELPPAVEEDGFYVIKELAEYMPPWEAFCHSRCGFYQDFYKVRWAEPHDTIDYSTHENGCPGEPGCTWEPDEMLPASLDGLRIETKRRWMVAQAQRETLLKRELEEAQAAEAKRARREVKLHKRDLKSPLDRDIVHVHIGHDHMPEKAEKLGDVASGWPCHPSDYPKGFGVAAPPGFCWKTPRDGKTACDCFDDARLQKSWEVSKNWIPTYNERGRIAQSALDAFGKETAFVRRRGLVTNMHFFEVTGSKFDIEAKHNSAIHAAVACQGALRTAAISIPVSSLLSDADPFYLPARAIISTGAKGHLSDYEPMGITAALQDGSPLPTWLHLDSATGMLSISSESSFTNDIQVTFEINFFEGPTKAFSSLITKELPAATAARLQKEIDAVKQTLGSADCSNMDEYLRSVMDNQLASIPTSSPGKFLQILSRCQSLLRSSVVANIMPPR